MTNGDTPSPEQIRLGDLIRGLKVSHAWGVSLALIGIVVAAFSLGYKAHSLALAVGVREATISAAKHDFCTRYNRYITARDLSRRSISPQDRETLKIAERMLFDLVNNWWSNQNKFSGELSFQPEIIRKGFDPTKSRVVFADGAEFIIPPEIKQRVLEAE